MQISDIQEIKESAFLRYEITIADEEGGDCMSFRLSEEDMWQIARYCKNNLSYAAKKNKL